MAEHNNSILPVLDRNSNTPLYQQIYEFFKDEITSGNMVPGSVLPPIREIVEQTATSVITIQRVLNELKAEGLIDGGRGKQCRVSSLNNWQVSNETTVREISMNKCFFPNLEFNWLKNTFSKVHSDVEITVKRLGAELHAISSLDTEYYQDDLLNISADPQLLDELNLNQTVSDIFKKQDNLPFLPVYLNTSVILFNKEIFENAGHPFPDDNWSWQDYISCAEKLHSPENDIYGFLCDFTIAKFAPILWSQNGEFFAEDGLQCALNTEEAAAAVEICQNLSKFNHPSVIDRNPTDLLAEIFIKNKAAMLFAGTANYTYLRELKTFRMDAAVPPGGKAFRHFSAYGIKKKEEENPLAIDLLKSIGELTLRIESRIEEAALPISQPWDSDNSTINTFRKAFTRGRTLFENIQPEKRGNLNTAAVRLVESACPEFNDPEIDIEKTLQKITRTVNRSLYADYHID
ncbi:MAG: extracellular solute-binding protein [Planctomycetota bacterium]